VFWRRELQSWLDSKEGRPASFGEWPQRAGLQCASLGATGLANCENLKILAGKGRWQAPMPAVGTLPGHSAVISIMHVHVCMTVSTTCEA
jgi:hypothetical protein